MSDLLSKRSVLIAVLTSLVGLCFAGGTAAQGDCVNTPEGRICRVQQPIRLGDPVAPDLQRQLGLVTLTTGCSGTLMNSWWVLTARHCVTIGATRSAPLLATNQVRITATWAPGRVATVARFYEFAVNTGPGVPQRDIILIYLAADLGQEANLQTVYITQPTTKVETWVGARLTEKDTVNQYGQGFSTFAGGVFNAPPPTPPAVQSAGLGTYRTARFTPSSITETAYVLVMNPAGQVGHGGDSGGPTVISAPNGRAFIAGVQSSCWPTGFVTNAPAFNWSWATGISFCTYVSVEPLVQEIGRVIQETPMPGALSVIQQYVLE